MTLKVKVTKWPFVHDQSVHTQAIYQALDDLHVHICFMARVSARPPKVRVTVRVGLDTSNKS